MIFNSIALVLAGMAVANAVACPDCTVYDFAAKAHGDLIVGLQGELGPFAVTGKFGEMLRIYDTDFTGGADPDLEVDKGKAIIIQNNAVGAAVPDDDPDGGTIVFTFPCSITLSSITFVDTEQNPIVKFFDAAGNNLGSVAGGMSGDSAFITKFYGKLNVKKIEVKLRESGGILNIQICHCTIHKFTRTHGYKIVGTLNELGGAFSVTGKSGEELRIYDTNFTGGADPDLEVDVGNAIIIQNNAVGVAVPDDDPDGGTIVFNFDTSILLKSVTFVDTEQNPIVKFFNASGTTLASVAGGVSGDSAFITKSYDKPNVKKMEVKLRGSAAVSEIVTCCPCAWPL